MKLLALIIGCGLAFGCILSLICVKPLLGLAFAIGAGAVFAWIETVEQRAFTERMDRTYGKGWERL